MNTQSLFKLARILNSRKYHFVANVVRGPSNIDRCSLLRNRLANQALIRLASTINTKDIEIPKEDGFVIKLLNKLPFVDLTKTRAYAVAFLLYECIVDNIDYIEFFEKYELPDTFYSWFVVTELHLWMWSVRAMAEGTIGRNLRNFLVEALWQDVAARSKKLGAANPSETRKQIEILSEQLQASLIAYDEGLQTNDIVLASAIWRRFYQQEEVEPGHLDSLVKYIRKQIRILDHIPKEKIFSKDILEWKPLELP